MPHARHRRHFAHAAAAVLLALPGAFAWSAKAVEANPSRGYLLYSTHCVACHNDQLHWRDKRIAHSPAALVAEVRRWQDVGRLGWTEADIEEVARHLDAVYYRFGKPRR